MGGNRRPGSAAFSYEHGHCAASCQPEVGQCLGCETAVEAIASRLDPRRQQRAPHGFVTNHKARDNRHGNRNDATVHMRRIGTRLALIQSSMAA